MPHPPEWIVELMARATPAIRGYELLAALGCHYFHNDFTEQWEVTLFASATEILGGRSDGKRTDCRFAVDLLSLTELMDEVSSFHWQAQSLGLDDDLGPHVSLEGVVLGRSVWLRILAQPPQGIDPGRIFHSSEQKLEELW